MHILGRRYIGIFLDPVSACNLRCRMCYFSDEEKRKKYKGRLSLEELKSIADAFFHRALKLQIGCGAEPSLFKQNKELILLAKEKKVPYVSMTTNGLLLSEKELLELAEAGLDEITLSLHGVVKETYEYFMSGAVYEVFLQKLSILTDIKRKYPDFKIRINYTVNQDNLRELGSFFDVFGSYHIDIMQIRPIQELGNTEYSNFSWDELYKNYDEIIESVKKECIERNITCIAPSRNDLIKETNSPNSISELIYCHISPRVIWEEDFNIAADTFDSYSKRNHLSRKYLKKAFGRKEISSDKRSLNYEII